MTSKARFRAVALTAVIWLAAVCSGCVIDVDLTNSPNSVALGEPVTFDVKLTNLSQCPVGQVIAFLIPFIPKDQCIDKIEDEELREGMRELVDAFCTGRDFEIPVGGRAACEFADGDLLCTISGDSVTGVPAGTPESVAVATTPAGDEVTCEAGGSSVTCRLPRSMLEMAYQAVGANAGAEPALPSVMCQEVDGLAICYALVLDAGAVATGQIQLRPETVGVLRSWVLAFAVKDEGVCKTGIPRRPCDEDGDCLGGSNTCGAGICVGGSNDGFGCDDDSECPDPAEGQCVQCGPVEDGEVLAGLSCTQIIASEAAPAPALSAWGLLAAVGVLVLVSSVSLRFHRRTRRRGN